MSKRTTRLAAAVAFLAPLVLFAGPQRAPAAPTGESALLLFASPAQDVRRLVAEAPENTDLSETYFGTPAFGVHMHIMGPGQHCPLHLHGKGYEAAVIVAGTGEVRSGPPAASGKKSRASSFTVAPGDIVISPPGSSHAFFNTTSGGHLATLVISSPPFTGNLYLTPDDPRAVGGPSPTVEHLGQAAAVGPGGIVRRKLPFAAAVGLARVDIAAGQRWTLTRNALFYVAAGTGFVSLPGANVPLEPGSLVGVRAGTVVAVAPISNRPLSLVEVGF